MKITIRDVAKQASVGVGTVSRVLNDSPAVRESTRKRVKAAIKQLDYRPNPTARRLSLGKTLTIALIVPYFTTEVSPVERLRGVEAAFTNSEYDLLLVNVESIQQRDRAFHHLSRRERVDGLLLITIPPSDADAERFERVGMPVILVDAYHPSLRCVVIDDIKGGYQATQHLIDLGHKNIAIITNEISNSFAFTSSSYRLEGYKKALNNAGIPYYPQNHQDTAHGPAAARDSARQLLQRPNRPTAIFVTSDTQAMGVLDAARELNIAVPEQLSVIGYDDIELAQYLNLTTIRQELFESGRKGAELLLEAMTQGIAPPQKIELPTKLIIRATTAPIPT